MEEEADSDELAGHIKQVAKKDLAAFERLYRATAPKLFGICLRILRDRSEAEDVLQEIYATIWLKAVGYDAGKASARTWLAVIARNKAIDRFRAQEPGRRLERPGVPLELQDAALTPAAHVEAADERRRLDECFEELEQGQAVAIRTAFLDGSTYEELARGVGVPLGTMKSLIRRGLMRLRECLER